MPIVKPSWRRTLHRTSRSSTKLRSAEILTSTSTGAHIKPLDPVLDPALHKPIDPELCSLHAASSPHRTAAETRSLPASCLIALLGRIVTCTAAGPGSPPTGAPRPDNPIIATSRWGRLVHQPPHCSPMGISWGSSPQGSPLTNHPSWRRRAQVRLAAPAERRGGFGTCAQSGRQGDQRTRPYLSLPAHRLSARLDPARRTHISERGPRAQPSGPPSLGRHSLRGSPGADSAPLGTHESNEGQLYPPTRTGHLPGYLALSLMPQLHDAMGAGAGRQKFQVCVDTHGASSAHGRPGADTIFLK